ncbi:CheY chemotaxis protein or a CheY-like REC (receiver) domain [Lachnospiraceae bacterium NE2001]|nr:CheY chemotaxis protein or a CheY-like REC (receiver) domain [Lachnospiraceae bacterium NE2001]SEQ98879.1 CheY chemotaxis protein or a CheY-like REC (receiver) domain [Lachnospiraceae bacterium NE2001]
MYYSTIGILAVLTLFIVNWDILRGFNVTYDKPAWNVYRRFLYAVLIYYITDILWGILESKKLVTSLFIDTTIYFVAMAVGISFWAEFTVAYLEEKTGFGRFLIYAGRTIAVTIAVLVIVNIFKPVLFIVDEDCVYKDLPLRDFMLVCQICLLIIISIYAFISLFKIEDDASKRVRYRILASFGLVTALCLFIQLWFPYLPIYSIAYMLGTCLLHSFVANDEKEDNKRRQELAKKIEELKERFSALLDNMPGMAFTKDAKTGVYLACNQGFAEYAQKNSPDEVVGLKAVDIFDADTAAHIVRDDKVALSLSKPYIFFEDIYDAAGNQKQLQTTKLKYTDTSGRLCVLGMCQDVTDMVSVQHEQAMTKEAYENAISSGLMFTNIAQTLARDYIDMYYIDGDTEEFIEYQKDEEGGALTEVRRGWHFFSDCKLELSEMVCEEDREAFLQALHRKTLMKVLENKNTFSLTYRVKTVDEGVYVNMKISKMDDEKYIIMGITNVDAEMRETMAKNEALANALSSIEKVNKDKVAFLSSMTHEIRTPINVIIGLETLAMKNAQMDDKSREYMEKIGESANQLLGIINDVLIVGRSDTGRVDDLDAVKSKDNEELVDYLEKNTSSSLDLNALNVLVIDDNPIEAEYALMVLKEVGIRADACTSGQEALQKMEVQKGKQKLYNLVLMDWSMEGMSGLETATEIRRLYSGKCTVVAHTANNWEDIREEAQGTGVYNYLAKPLFEANILANIEQIARQCDMNIFKEKKRAKLSGRRILLAEDVEINAEILTDTLEIENIKVDHVANGLEAVKMFEQSTAGIYGAILMDVRMPVMDGLEASRAIRALDREDAKRIPIIALTANAFDDDVQRSLQAGMNAHLTKPVDMENLLRILGELIYEAEVS